MEGMTDWNKLTMEQYIEHLEEKFKFDSSGTAKAVFELINAYKALLIQSVSQQRELLSWMKKNHHLGKTEEQINELLLDYNFEQLNCG